MREGGRRNECDERKRDEDARGDGASVSYRWREGESFCTWSEYLHSQFNCLVEKCLTRNHLYMWLEKWVDYVFLLPPSPRTFFSSLLLLLYSSIWKVKLLNKGMSFCPFFPPHLLLPSLSLSLSLSLSFSLSTFLLYLLHTQSYY